MNEQLATAVEAIAMEVLASLIEPADCAAAAGDAGAGTLACEVAITGAFRGRVQVVASQVLAGRIARHMFGEDGEGTPEELAREAARELSNIVAGNIKAVLGAGNVLGLPTEVISQEHAESIASAAVLNGALRVQVLQVS